MALLENYPKLRYVVERLDKYLQESHPTFFGSEARHPVFPLKSQKIIHDNLWGTFSLSWQELVMLDSPLIQRLRDIHQVGLAYQIYPSARHSRLEHSLGVVLMASRIFDALLAKDTGKIKDAVRVAYGLTGVEEINGKIDQIRRELRLAALLHDCGHSIHSHASERIYSKLPVLQEAAAELSRFVGKRKGVGEVISFCFVLTPCLSALLARGAEKIIQNGRSARCEVGISLENVALCIVGRSNHPFLQFLGDIISSDIDADKLDYLLRDSQSAGLPLRYDVDMYLHSAQIELDELADGDGELRALYSATGIKSVEEKQVGPSASMPGFEAYRLKLPKRAMHVLEQIVICKMMLFSYVYHHPKVRAAEGLLERLLDDLVEERRNQNEDDWKILEWFMEASDAHLHELSKDRGSASAHERAYRIVNRILPREVMRFAASEAGGPQKALMSGFITQLRDKEKGIQLLQRLEEKTGEKLLELPDFAGLSWKAAMAKAGAWVDLPKAPKFEDTQKLISRTNGGSSDQAGGMFPVHAWQHAYASYRSYLRVYAYTEYYDAVRTAAESAMQEVVGINDQAFYHCAERSRF